MATLVFDIKTKGESWQSLDAQTQHSLTHWIGRVAQTGSDEVHLQEGVKKGLGQSPFTGAIYLLTVYDIERKAGVVYHTFPLTEGINIPSEYTCKQRTEAELVQEFWQGVRSYDTVVTYNGRAFAVPFLMHRALAHGVTPYLPLLQKYHGATLGRLNHVDLLEELTLHGAMKRRPSLHLLCRTYGITGPKYLIEGVTMETLYDDKSYATLAQYGADGVRAIAGLYHIFKKHLNLDVE